MLQTSKYMSLYEELQSKCIANNSTTLKTAHILIHYRVCMGVMCIFSLVKLLLQGSIGCRLGTLLLTGDQVQVLGGGVETLAEANHQKRVLARAL